MGPAIFFQHRIGEVLHPETQAGDTQFPQRLDLGFLQGARLTFKGDLFGLVPADVGPQTIDQ